MQYKLILSLLLLSHSLLFAQTYQVIKVDGKITRGTTGQVLNTSDKISGDEVLHFTNTDKQFAFAAIIRTTDNARFFAALPKEKAGVHKSTVKDCLIQTRALAGARKGKLNTILDIRTYLGDEDFLIMGDALVLEINPENLAMNADSFFIVTYQYRGETIPKKLSFSGDKLWLRADEIYRVDQQPIDPEETSDLKLIYYKPGLKAQELVSSFHPVFSSHLDVDGELKAILDATGAMEQLKKIQNELQIEKIKKELAAYLIEIYGDGKGDEDNLDEWLNQYLINLMSRK